MNLIIDNRETKLIEACKTLISSSFKDITYTLSNLDLGDVIISNKDGKEVIVFERKCIPDLLASIKDGRYLEQSFRLDKACEIPNHNIYYIIEGNILKNSNNNMIYSSVLSLSFFKGFSVLRTDNQNETAFMILQFFTKLVKEENKKTPYYSISSSSIDCNVTEQQLDNGKVDYTTTIIQKKKNSNITTDNFAEIVLCQIPSVSNVTAKSILSRYNNNLIFLIESLTKDPNCLDNIKENNRKISKLCISNIKKFLLHNPQLTDLE